MAVLVLFSVPAYADVAENGSGTATNAANSVTTLDVTTFTVDAGSNLGLVAFLHNNGSTTSPSCSWDSAGTPQAMTSAGAAVTNGNSKVQMFYLVNPTPGNKTLTCSWTTSRNARIVAVAWSGVDQATMLSNYTTNSGTGTALTIPVTGISAGATVAGTSVASTSVSSVDTGTEVFKGGGILPGTAVSYVLNASGATNHDYTAAASNAWGAVGANVNAASGGCTLSLLGVGRC